MINLRQFREEIVLPVLLRLDVADPGQHSVAAEQLLLGTLVTESAGKYLRQLGGGPAVSMFQIEPATARDVFENYLAYHDSLRATILAMIPKWPGYSDLTKTLTMCPAFACAIARQCYRRDQAPLPAAGNADDMAAMWKKIYNTPRGAGDPQVFTALFRRHVVPLYQTENH